MNKGIVVCLKERTKWMRALLLFLVIPITLCFSDQGKIKGKIADKHDESPLASVNIYVIGTKYGTTSDSLGYFVLSEISADTFTIRTSLMGYSHRYFHIKKDSVSKTDLIIYMERKLIELSDITITENRPVINLHNKDLQSISIRKVKQLAGNLNDVVRSLLILPGFAKPYEYRNDLIVRGGSPSENLFLIDGIIVPSINHFTDQGFTGGPVSFIDPVLLRDISISSGGFNAVYGDKLSAVVDLELKEGSSEEMSNIISASGTQFSFNSDYAINNNISYVISLRRSFLDPLFRLYGFVYYPEYYDLTAKLKIKLSRLNSLSFLIIGTHDAVKFFDEQNDIRNSNPRAVGNNQSRYISAISFNHIFNTGSFQLNISRSSFKLITIPNYFFANNSSEAENSLKADLHYHLSQAVSVSIGSVVSFIESRIDAEFYNYKSSYNEVFDAAIKSNKKYLKMSSYFNYTHHVKKFEVNAGIRVDYFTPMNSEEAVSPRFALKYKINSRRSISLKTGIYHQSPSYVWLSGDPINVRLKNLRSEHYIAGYDYIISKQFDLKAEVYLKNYSNYPVSVKRPYLVLSNTGGEFSGTDNNFATYGIEPLESKGEGSSKGLEITINHKNKNIPLNIDANFSVSETYFFGLDGIKHPSTFDQRWILNLMASYSFSEIWSANIKFFYASGAPYTPFDSEGLQKQEDFNTLRMPDVHSLDLRLEKRFSATSGSMFYLDIKNVYNRKNLYYYYYDTYTRKVTHDPVIRILPTFGITLEL